MKFETVTTIFGSIDILVNVHKDFIVKLKKSYDSYPHHNISSVFLESINGFQIYPQYVENFSLAIHALHSEKSTSKPFFEFISVCFF